MNKSDKDKGSFQKKTGKPKSPPAPWHGKTKTGREGPEKPKRRATRHEVREARESRTSLQNPRKPRKPYSKDLLETFISSASVACAYRRVSEHHIVHCPSSLIFGLYIYICGLLITILSCLSLWPLMLAAQWP